LESGKIAVLVAGPNFCPHQRRDFIRSPSAQQCELQGTAGRWPEAASAPNPIEQVFAKLKHLLRKAAARTQAAVSLAIGHLLDSFTAAECANYFRNSDMLPAKSITL
jgi:hypothetical protein